MPIYQGSVQATNIYYGPVAIAGLYVGPTQGDLTSPFLPPPGYRWTFVYEGSAIICEGNQRVIELVEV